MDCSTLIRALHHIPLANEGETHARLRKDMAQLVASQVKGAKRHLATYIRATVTNVCQSGARVDLVESLIRPIADTFFAFLLGMDLPDKESDGVSVSQIFDRFLGLNRRKAIAKKAYDILKTFSGAAERLKTSPDYALAVTIIGHDSLVGSLGGSLLKVLKDGAGKRLSELSFPQSMPATGVPYVERLARRDCRIDGMTVRAGERVRLFLDATLSEARPEPRLLFGKGRHSCIGEDISLWIWQSLSAELSRLPLRFSIQTVRQRKRDYVFSYYSSLVVQFHD